MHIFVGSTNPVKINAVTQAASETWPGVSVRGFEVASGVSDQPRSDEETRLGAENRAKAALELGLRGKGLGLSSNTMAYDLNPGHYIGVGLEGGVFERENGELWNTVWVSVVDVDGNIVSANGERFQLPDSLATLIRSGKEMGPAMDKLIGSENIKHKQGMIGVVTRGFIDRTEMYAGLAKLGLGLWHGREWESMLDSR